MVITTNTLQDLLAQRNIPSIFTREHDVILLAEPFALHHQLWTRAHTERLREAIARHFLCFATFLVEEDLIAALARSCTDQLGYRLIHRLAQAAAKPHTSAAILLTCAPKAHLALTNFLERGALLTVETIGRVTRRYTL